MAVAATIATQGTLVTIQSRCHPPILFLLIAAA